MTDITQMEPRELWRWFAEVSATPRGSKDEGRIAKFIMDFAKERGLEARRDAAGNVLVRKPGTHGGEGRPTVVLQGHMDMVCEKNADTEHDFTKDPIELVAEGGWLHANGTTLGADNGIGVAAALAVLDSEELAHGPIEALFTADEETGLTGAFNLDPSMLSGRTMLNLDSEEEGTIYVGCAGGGDTHITLEVKKEGDAAGWPTLRVRAKGLRGGHSGVDVHEQRGNAVKILARLIDSAGECRVADLNGGGKHNAIPREASAVVFVPDMEAAKQKVMELAQQIKAEYQPIDPGLDVAVSDAQGMSEGLCQEDSDRLVDLLNALPHGVLKMSYDIPNLVQTSTNLASVKTMGSEVKVHMSSRSSIASELEEVRSRIEAMAHLAGASVEHSDAYPGWKPDLGSKILALAKEVHKEAFGTEASIKAIHAGLETGVIGEKFPGMDMISIGPQIEHPHSPEERVGIGSVERFWTFLTKILEETA